MKWTVIKGILAGVIFVSAGYWATVLSWVTDLNYNTLVSGVAFITNIGIGFLLSDKSYGKLLTAWALSITFGFITFLIYACVGFLDICHNMLFPNDHTTYGLLWPMSIPIFLDILFYFFFAIIMAIGVTAIKKAHVKKSNKDSGL